MNKVIVEVSKKILIALGTGAGALLAKAATEKGIGQAIKALAKKEVIEDVVETTMNEGGDFVADTASIFDEVAEAAEAVADEVSGA